MLSVVSRTRLHMLTTWPSLYKSNKASLISLLLKHTEERPPCRNAFTLCTLRLQDQLAPTFHLLHHLKCWHGLSAVSFSSLVLLAPADELPAKFYYTLNKPAYSPVSRTHYEVSGITDTVKHHFYYHIPDMSSFPGCYVSNSYFMAAGQKIWLIRFNVRCVRKKKILYIINLQVVNISYCLLFESSEKGQNTVFL